MDEGLFTLIFILIFVVMSVMDAVGRRRKRSRRMEEMDREEGGEHPRRPERASTRGPAREGPGARQERETADQMIPEDFWAILTGEAPPDAGSDLPGEAGEGRGEPEPDDRSVPGAGARAEGPRVEHETELREPDRLGRRGDPSPPKEPEIPMPLPGDRMSSHDEEAGWDGHDSAGAMEEPWGALEDISAGDVSTGTAKPHQPGSRRTPPPPTRPRRRRRRKARYTQLLETGGVEELRTAVVLREVLDRPLALRDDDGGGSPW